MTNTTAKITGVNGWVPEDVLTNADLEKMVDTNDEWIRTRTGISERRILKGEGKATSYMGTRAVQGLLEKTNTDPATVDLVICATITPDMMFPTTANLIASAVGATNAYSYDLTAACSGFLFALHTASQYIVAGTHKKVVVVGADKMSSITNYEDRNTCILFGDASAAVLLEPDTEGLGIQDAILRTDAVGEPFLNMKAGGSLNPASHETVDAKLHTVFQDGRNVFKYAVKGMADISVEMMDKHQLTAEDIAWLVPHQANKRIIDATGERMGLDPSKVQVNIQKYGNTTAATIPLCLWEYEDRMKKGDNIILAAFGGGFTWGSIWLKWAY